MKILTPLLFFPVPALAAGNNGMAIYDYMLYGSIFLLCLSVVILFLRNRNENKRNYILNEIYNREKLNRGMIEARTRTLLGRIDEELSIHNNEYNMSMRLIQSDLVKFSDLLHSDFAHIEDPEKTLDEIAARFYRANEEVHSHECFSFQEIEVRSMDDILKEAIQYHADRLRIAKNEIYFIFNHNVISHETIRDEEFWFLMFEAGKINEIFIDNENGEKIQAIISRSMDNTVEMFFVQND